MKFEQWNGFAEGTWTDSIDVRGFIQENYTPYTGDDSFLADSTEKTKKLWDIVLDLYKKLVQAYFKIEKTEVAN